MDGQRPDFPWAFLLALALAVVAIGWLVFISPAQRAIAAPCMVAIGIGICLLAYEWKVEGTLPLLNVGLICVAATLLYMVFPLAGYYLDGLQFGPAADARLQRMQPGPFELGEFHWRHVLYIAALSAVYAVTCSRHRVPEVELPANDRSNGRAGLVLLLIFAAFFFLLERFTGFTFRESYTEASRNFGTAQQAQVSLPMLQVTHYLYGMMVIFKLAVLIYVVRRARSAWWLLVLISWLLGEYLLTASIQGARTQLVLLLLSVGLIFHRTVRPIPWWTLVAIATVGLWWFLSFGQTRASLSGTDPNMSLVTAGNEFQSLLGTAWDVYQRQIHGGLDVPWQLYFSDVIGLLPPQQFLPFEKTTGWMWYKELVAPQLRYSRPTGWMWGVTTQAQIGLGWPEMGIRGATLGWVLARLHRLYRLHSSSPAALMSYVWLCGIVYITYRDTTFSPASRVVFILVPALFLLSAATSLAKTLRG